MRDRITISSWALHRTLAVSYPDSPATGPRAEDQHAPGPGIPLLELPAALAARGYHQLQLTHFHLPSRDPAYLAHFRAALDAAGVKLLTVLIDDGDITHPEHFERDLAWIEGWLRLTEQLGAERARVIGGKQPFDADSLARSIAGLRRLADAAGPVRLETENWYSTLSHPEAVNAVLDALDGRVGLCADWGNWPRPEKYETLPRILLRAETVHAKMEFLTSDALDEEDAVALINLTRDSGFAGPLVIVNGGTGDDEWEAIATQAEMLR